MKPGYGLIFKEGDIVYWCHHGGNANYSVHFGRVDTQFHDVVCIDYLELRERRLVDGVPLEEFKSEQHYRKLPKGWSYDTKLFEITYREDSLYEYGKTLKINNPDDVKEGYNKGLLVKAETIFHGNIESEITKDGFRIVKKYPDWQHHIDGVSVVPFKLYFTYEEAQKEVDDNVAEFHRKASLSEYDWSVEDIDKTLNHWQKLTDSSDKEKNEYRKWILDRKNVEDIETRIFGGNIQWRYWKNKRWNNIEL